MCCSLVVVVAALVIVVERGIIVTGVCCIRKIIFTVVYPDKGENAEQRNYAHAIVIFCLLFWRLNFLSFVLAPYVDFYSASPGVFSLFCMNLPERNQNDFVFTLKQESMQVCRYYICIYIYIYTNYVRIAD